MGNIGSSLVKVFSEISKLLLFYILDSNINSSQVNKNENENEKEYLNGMEIEVPSNNFISSNDRKIEIIHESSSDNEKSSNISFLGKKQERDDKNESSNLNPIRPLYKKKNSNDNQPDTFDLIREKIDFVQQKYFKIKSDLSCPGSESLMLKYTCEECFDMLISLPAVKCSNCKSTYWCSSCFYKKTTANMCKKCGMNIVIPLQLNLEEINELNKINLKCPNFKIGCHMDIPYDLFYEHGINCSLAPIRNYLDDNTKYIYLEQYESNTNKRKIVSKQKDAYYNTDNNYNHLRQSNPITMNRNYDLRENYLLILKDVTPECQKLAFKYKCILCKFNKRDCLPRNEVAKCGYCNGVFCLNCFYERKLASGPSFYGSKIHENNCPECFNFLFIPNNLTFDEMKELKTIKIKCKYNDRGCSFDNYYHEIPLHATTCEFAHKHVSIQSIPVLEPPKITNINPIPKEPVDEDEIDDIYDLEINKIKYLKDVSNIKDQELLKYISIHALSRMTVENLKGFLLHRDLKIGSKLKDDLIERLKNYLKEKFSDQYVYDKIISRENFGSFKLDELKGLLVLKGYPSNLLEKKSKADCVDLLKSFSKRK